MDLRTIFEHTDEDGDSLKVSEWTPPERPQEHRLVVAASSADRHPEYAAANLAESEVILDRKEALRLYGTLGQWLHGDPSATPTKVGLIGNRVQEAFQEYHLLNPQPDAWGAPCARCKHAEGVHTARYGCGAIDSNGECGCTEYTGAYAPAPTPEHPECKCMESAG